MISIVMPAHNEHGYLEPAVKTVVAGLRERRLAFEVIVAENGSTDDTAAEADSLAHTYPEVVALRDPTADYGLALKVGFLAARGDVVVNFDVDFVDLEFLDRAMALMASGEPAIVVGSKRSPGSEDERSPARRTVTAVFSLVLRYGFGLRVSDTHGVKALRRAPLLPLVESSRFGGDIFDTELILRAERTGLVVTEVPVVVTDQRPPRTPITRRIPRSLVGLVRLRLVLGRGDARRST
jgi:glycosyltransferase involved in cell wall biosynthesis